MYNGIVVAEEHFLQNTFDCVKTMHSGCLILSDSYTISTILAFHRNGVLTSFLFDSAQNFFNCYLAAPQLTSGHYPGDSLTHPILITAFYIFHPKVTGSLEGHREPVIIGFWYYCNFIICLK